MTTSLIGILLLVVLAVTALASWGLLAWLALPGRAAPRLPEDEAVAAEATEPAPGGSRRADAGCPEPRWMGFR